MVGICFLSIIFVAVCCFQINSVLFGEAAAFDLPHKTSSAGGLRQRGGEVPLTVKEQAKHPRFRRSLRSKRDTADAVPLCFDARDKWPKCQSIREIRDQGQCGTCWAVAAASVLSDRLCIASGQNDQTFVSALHLAACSSPEQTGCDNCNSGGNVVSAYQYTARYGYITGGNKTGCEPYPMINRPIPLDCPTTCTNPNHIPQNPADDLRMIHRKPGTDNEHAYWTHFQSGYFDDDISDTVKAMQMEIMTNGPVTAGDIILYTDWQDWNPLQGAYRGPSEDAEFFGYHAVRVIGWCTDQFNVPYWTIANSWGAGVGDGGVYWVERGKNVINVESAFSAPVVSNAACPEAVDVDVTCPSLCDSAIDQIVRLDSANMASPIYVFQGACVTEVAITLDGKLKALGEPVPTATLFVGTPSGRISGWDPENSKSFWLRNSTASSYCSSLPNCDVYKCATDPSSGGQSAQTYLNGTRYSYVMKYPSYWIAGSAGVDIGNLITSKFTQVNALLSLDLEGVPDILICGISSSGDAGCGYINAAGNTISSRVMPVRDVFKNC
ncbi:cathepsin B-like cysteine proteinase 1 [Paramacrobiotus metropolitanus]|uniref:cathepsin B-like cysteine proteinase 1 n=1 Tax=Paramacrobiotus metropolitanus TaxID=2943436 RepID=UPI0024464632|nr:cathepsin B-like cysteine proteinase 1 [Paramacrobiotus metropolitanus]